MSDYSQAPNTVIKLAKKIIKKHHPKLNDATFGFVFFSKPKKSKGRTVYASVKKPTAQMKAYDVFENMDFLIEISEDEYSRMDTKRREALIDHELCHCNYNTETESASIVGHDIEEFTEILNRHGFWTASLLKSKKAFDEASQFRLPGLGRKNKGDVKLVDPADMPAH